MATKAAAKKAQEQAAAERREQAAQDLYRHLRVNLGAEVGIDHARQIVETVAATLSEGGEE